MAEKIISAIIVEDQVMLRDSLKKLLESLGNIKVSALTGNAAEAPELCRRIKPAIVLMDVLTENGANGIEYGKRILEEMPDIKIIAMTALPEITFIEKAHNAGIHSFIYKNSTGEFLQFVIKSTLEGRGIYPGPADEHPLKNAFSDREIAIIRLVCQGKDREEIAKAMAMSESNVKKLITNILDKTGFDSIMKFAVYAVGKGLIVADMDS